MTNKPPLTVEEACTSIQRLSSHISRSYFVFGFLMGTAVTVLLGALLISLLLR